jgi:signal transduction histidine kinase
VDAHRYQPTFVAHAGGALFTLLAFSPIVNVAYRSPSLHVVLETTTALTALLAAYLVFGRFRYSRDFGDLVLVFPLVLLASANVFMSGLATVADLSQPLVFGAWAPAVVRLLGAVALATAAFAPRAPLPNPRGAARFIAAACAATLAVVGVLLALLNGVLPAAVETTGPADAASPMVVAHSALVGTQLAAAVLFGVAALGFARRAARESDELFHWFSAGTVLAAYSSLHYAVSPTLYSDWVYTGDFFRIGCYLLLLAGAAREIGRYWRSRAEAAALEERRRLARDLHDGLAHELAFIAAEVKELETEPESERLSAVTAAAERALGESRRAIATLTRRVEEPLDVALANAAEEVAGRVGARLRIDLSPDVAVSVTTREMLVRIVREAVVNAVRHGGAREIKLGLSNGGRPRLTVVDDGVGFDPESASRGFGLTSMEERAREIGAAFRLVSQAGIGTQVEVTLP